MLRQSVILNRYIRATAFSLTPVIESLGPSNGPAPHQQSGPGDHKYLASRNFLNFIDNVAGETSTTTTSSSSKSNQDGNAIGATSMSAASPDAIKASLIERLDIGTILDSSVSNPSLGPEFVIAKLNEKQAALGSPAGARSLRRLRLSPEQAAILSLRTSRRLVCAIERASMEPFSWPTSVAESRKFPRTESRKATLRRMLGYIRKDDRIMMDSLLLSEETRSGSSSSESSVHRKSPMLLRAALRRASLLRDVKAACSILEDLVLMSMTADSDGSRPAERFQLNHRDFHLAIHAARVGRFDDCAVKEEENNNSSSTNTNTNNNGKRSGTTFTAALEIYKLMVHRAGLRPKVATVIALANAASTRQDAENVVGMWTAMLLLRSSSKLRVSPAIVATAAVVRAIGRGFRNEMMMMATPASVSSSSSPSMLSSSHPQYEDGSPAHSSTNEMEDESADPTQLSTAGLTLLERLVRELLDALATRRHVINSNVTLLTSIALALADLGEWQKCGKLMSRISRIGLLHGNRFGENAAIAQEVVAGNPMLHTSTISSIHYVSVPTTTATTTTTTATTRGGNNNNNNSNNRAGSARDVVFGADNESFSLDVLSLHVEAPILAALLLPKRNPPRFGIAAALEQYVGTMVSRRLLPPSATNTLLLSLVLYGVTLPPTQKDAISALQACFVVAGLLKRYKAGWNAHTVALLFRAVEATGLVSIALDPNNTVDAASCGALLTVAAQYLQHFGTDSAATMESLTSLSFLLSLGESVRVLNSSAQQHKQPSGGRHATEMMSGDDERALLQLTDQIAFLAHEADVIGERMIQQRLSDHRGRATPASAMFASASGDVPSSSSSSSSSTPAISTFFDQEIQQMLSRRKGEETDEEERMYGSDQQTTTRGDRGGGGAVATNFSTTTNSEHWKYIVGNPLQLVEDQVFSSCASGLSGDGGSGTYDEMKTKMTEKKKVLYIVHFGASGNMDGKSVSSKQNSRQQAPYTKEMVERCLVNLISGSSTYRRIVFSVQALCRMLDCVVLPTSEVSLFFSLDQFFGRIVSTAALVSPNKLQQLQQQRSVVDDDGESDGGAGSKQLPTFVVVSPFVAATLHSSVARSSLLSHDEQSATDVEEFEDLMERMLQQEQQHPAAAPQWMSSGDDQSSSMHESPLLSEQYWAAEGYRLRPYRCEENAAPPGTTDTTTRRQQRLGSSRTSGFGSTQKDDDEGDIATLERVVERSPFSNFCEHLQPALIGELSMAPSSSSSTSSSSYSANRRSDGMDENEEEDQEEAEYVEAKDQPVSKVITKWL